MVHVKKVEIFGFKSFGFKNTIVSFEPGLVSICGPNGSGKSNILDAIIFALGENKPKTMRADRLHSLLHSTGAQHRGPKFARVKVTFDNSDRKIPIDSDSVDITRELNTKGDNTYYLNKKQTKRSQILDLLEIANAGLHQLNVVQQGTVTRISGFTSEEKRETIEDLIGLSYFDQKKTEALKTLDQADQRLEVAMAKMGEMKQRIDELEEERNQMLRHGILGREIRRLEGIMAAAKLDEIRRRCASKETELEDLTASGTGLEQEHRTIRAQIAKLDAEKAEFLDKEDRYKKAKASIESELSDAIRQYDEAGSKITASKNRLSQIGAKIPALEESAKALCTRQDDLNAGTAELQKEIDQIRQSRERITADIRKIDAEASLVRTHQTELVRIKNRTDSAVKSLEQKLNSHKLELAKMQSEMQTVDANHARTVSTLSRYRAASENFSVLLSKYERRIENHKNSIGILASRLDRHDAQCRRIKTDVDDTAIILEKATRAATQYEAKIRTVKGMMHEDYSIAQLHENHDLLGIKGLVYQMISWDPKYERAALAAGADWIKAFVVPDFATLLMLADVARERKLPKLKIIPLDTIPDMHVEPPEADGVLGMLSDFIKSRPEYSGIIRFLFGNVVLADAVETAYAISRAGYKAVTLDGQLFEARAGAAIVDTNSKISKLTRVITLSSSVDGLLRSVSLLKKYIAKSKGRIKRLENEISSLQKRKSLSESKLASVTQSHSDLKIKAADISARLVKFDHSIREYSEKSGSLAARISDEESGIHSIEKQIRTTVSAYDEQQQAVAAEKLEKLGRKKSELEKEQTRIITEHADHSSRLGTSTAAQANTQSQIDDVRSNITSLGREQKTLQDIIQDNSKIQQEYGDRLVKLRQTEQDLINTSGTSVSVLREYDEKLGALNLQDKSLERQLSANRHRSDILSRDLEDLADQARSFTTTLDSSGVKDPDIFDVGPLLAELKAEQQSLVTLNAKAPEAYIVHSDGYRSMSARKNSLENERNSIVKFIEDIEKDKKQTFLDAFDKVDKEIRQMFASMTGGTAWLELQNEDDIFSSGISYMIQFPNKQKRESMSISGGEQTLAAVVFVLALQRLKPSPFYLFDELDAALDAENAKRLSAILTERSEQSQFIVVSHKESVVQKANLIYGVFSKNDTSNVLLYRDRQAPKTV